MNHLRRFEPSTCMSLRSAENVALMNLLMNETAYSRPNSKLWTASNHTCIRRSPICRRNRIIPADLIGSTFAFLTLRKFQPLMSDVQADSRDGLPTTIGPATVSIKQLDSFISCSLLLTRTYVLLLVLVNTALHSDPD